MSRPLAQPTRFYGLALGKELNFNAGTDGLITDAVTSPDVSTKSLFYTDCTASNAIADFTNGAEGQIVTLITLDSNTTITNGTIKNADGVDKLMGVGDTAVYIKHGASWYEIASRHTSTGIQTLSNVKNAASSATLAVGTKILKVMGSAGAMSVLWNLSGGSIGDTVLIVGGSVGPTFTIEAGNNLFINGTAKLTVSGTAVGLAFTKVSDTNWYALGWGTV